VRIIRFANIPESGVAGVKQSINKSCIFHFSLCFGS
jgi:hypothetical protein